MMIGVVKKLWLSKQKNKRYNPEQKEVKKMKKLEIDVVLWALSGVLVIYLTVTYAIIWPIMCWIFAPFVIVPVKEVIKWKQRRM